MGGCLLTTLSVRGDRRPNQWNGGGSTGATGAVRTRIESFTGAVRTRIGESLPGSPRTKDPSVQTRRPSLLSRSMIRPTLTRQHSMSSSGPDDPGGVGQNAKNSPVHRRRIRRPSKLRSSLLSSSVLLPNLEEDECVIAAKAVTERSSIEQPNKCPFGHGTVYSSPYPGYVHGNKKRGICPNGCRPIVDSELLEKEGPQQTVMREALEFLELYYKERQADMAKKEGFLSQSERIDQVKTSIETTGTYAHTFDELQHGARVAWRSKLPNLHNVRLVPILLFASR